VERLRHGRADFPQTVSGQRRRAPSEDAIGQLRASGFAENLLGAIGDLPRNPGIAEEPEPARRRLRRGVRLLCEPRLELGETLAGGTAAAGPRDRLEPQTRDPVPFAAVRWSRRGRLEGPLGAVPVALIDEAVSFFERELSDLEAVPEGLGEPPG